MIVSASPSISLRLSVTKVDPLTLTIRPSGPLPLICPSGIPRSNAIFLANGLAKNFGFSPCPGFSGAFAASVRAFPEPYFV